MSEKAVSIGFYFVTFGIFIVLNEPFSVTGSDGVMNFLTDEVKSVTGGKFAFEGDPKKVSELMIDHIERKREALDLKSVMYAS